ncbi:MAG: histidinol-phosphatase [Planctomycetota bacterium]|jgi:histidinol phosphatase-like enzyme (inositol monophosphatase family)
MTDIEAAELEARLDFALNAAERAGEFIMSHYQSPELAVDRKRDASPVTEADRGAEQLIRELLAETYPNDAILGEEFGESEGTSGWRWILDPVDGTKSFIHGVPLFGTLIGLEHGDDQVAGVCRLPALGEVVYAGRGLGAFWQVGSNEPRPARVSEVSDLSEATFCTTTIQGWSRVGREAAFQRFCETAQISRGWGDCYGHALVATGRVDVMVDPLLNAWDCAPLVPIMQEAGGHFVDFAGEVSIHSNNGLSVNAGLKDAALSLLRAD